jgi:hypothetical protein
LEEGKRRCPRAVPDLNLADNIGSEGDIVKTVVAINNGERSV